MSKPLTFAELKFLVETLCPFCKDVDRVLAWSGYTPFRNKLVVSICPKCYSTHYLCSSKQDKMFKIIEQINRAFMEIWRKKPKL